jgi:hypothetical protein
MQKGLSKLMRATTVALLALSFLFATPAFAVNPPPYALASEPVWATVNAAAQGNYPGGNEVFDIFVVNSALPPNGNLSIDSMTLSTSAWSHANSNFGIGLPATLLPEQSLLFTIALEIPSNFTLSNFTASLAINTRLWNGTAYIPLKLTGTSQVFMLVLPGQSGGQATTATTTTVTQTVTQSGGVSTTLFTAGVAIPALVAIVFLVLLVQARGRSKPAGP